MKKLCLLILILAATPSCKKVTIKQERSRLQQQTYTRFGVQPTTSIEIPKHGLSKYHAVRIALQHNAELQAAFQELGIAKADLKQAGLFTNPRIDSVFRIPTKSRRKTSIESDLLFSLADFWQVPLRKKVAHDDLEILSLSILQLIIEIITNTQKAYNQCLYAQANYNLVNSIYKKVCALRNRIAYRQQFGYTNDFDIYTADVLVGSWQTKRIAHKKEYHDAWIHLRTLLGTPIIPKPLPLTDTLTAQDKPQSPIEELITYALHNRPEVLIADQKIRKAQHQLSLERAQVIKEADIGIGFKRDFDSTKGAGPAFGINIPLFDSNRAQIERAQFALAQAKKQLLAHKRHVIAQVHEAYQQRKALQEQMTVYKNQMLPAQQNALAFVEKYFNAMQLNMITVLETCIKLYEIEQEYIAIRYHAAQTHATLQQVIGGYLS